MKRRGANLGIFLFGMILISLFGCEEECVQGAMNECRCLSGFVTWQACSDNGGDWQDCPCACNEGDKPRKCACPEVGHVVPMFKQYCEATAETKFAWQWQPCDCPITDTDSSTSSADTEGDSDTSKDSEVVDSGADDAGK